MKLNVNQFSKSTSGFAKKSVVATGKVAEETREVSKDGMTYHFLPIEVKEVNGDSTYSIQILVQPVLELIELAVQYRMDTAFEIEFNPTLCQWQEVRKTNTTDNATTDTNNTALNLKDLVAKKTSKK